MIRLIDTHCHIHDSAFSDKFEHKSSDVMVQEAAESGVATLICVGTDLQSSKQAINFCAGQDSCYAAIALHPHEAAGLNKDSVISCVESLREYAQKAPKKLIAIGETGLDYFYHDDQHTLELQELLFRKHIELAVELDLPLIFHIRDAFDDFFRIFDDYSNLQGVVHSFSTTNKELDGVLERGLYVGLNGIMTFTKDESQLSAAKSVPLDKIVIETDAPFLTPVPLRGKMCEPKHVRLTAEFLSNLRGESLETFAHATTRNAHQLFGL